MIEDVAYLLSPRYEKDEFGVLKATKNYLKRLVYIKVSSVTRSEWFEGGRNGLNPELKVELFAPDYLSEELMEYNGRIYTIYRTYRTTKDTMELYCERRKGRDGYEAC